MAKTYIDGASCKAVNGSFGEFFNISFNLEKLQQYVNEKGYVNLTLSKRKEVGQYGDTHYFTLNEWSKDGSAQKDESTSNGNYQNTSNNTSEGEEISIEDIPF